MPPRCIRSQAHSAVPSARLFFDKKAAGHLDQLVIEIVRVLFRICTGQVQQLLQAGHGDGIHQLQIYSMTSMDFTPGVDDGTCDITVTASF